MSRCDSAAIVAKTSELLPEPETPVKAVRRRLGSSTVMSRRLFSRAPCTRITSWRSAGTAYGVVAVASPETVVIVSAMGRRYGRPPGDARDYRRGTLTAAGRRGRAGA